MKIPHNRPTLGKEEIKITEKILRSGWIGQGQAVEKFESEFCQYMGIPEGHAVAVSSGSAALYLAAMALNVKNKRVGIPIYTCAAIGNAIFLAQGKKVYIDNDNKSPNLDFNKLNLKFLSTVVAVSTFGIPITIPKIRKYKIIEDISQSLGSEVNGQRIGNRGDIGICSLSATKLITTGGQGGVVFSHNKNLIDFIRDYREFDAREDKKPRFNYQMTDIQAAIGTVQLKKLPNFLDHRQEIFNIYQKEGLDLAQSHDSNITVSKYRAVIRTKIPKKIQAQLASHQICSIIPFTERELSIGNNESNAAQYCKTTLSIPIYPTLSFKHASKIARIISNISEKF